MRTFSKAPSCDPKVGIISWSENSQLFVSPVAKPRFESCLLFELCKISNASLKLADRPVDEFLSPWLLRIGTNLVKMSSRFDATPLWIISSNKTSFQPCNFLDNFWRKTSLSLGLDFDNSIQIRYLSKSDRNYSLNSYLKIQNPQSSINIRKITIIQNFWVQKSSIH